MVTDFSIVTVLLPSTTVPPLLTDCMQRLTSALVKGQNWNLVNSPTRCAEALPARASVASAAASIAVHTTPALLLCFLISLLQSLMGLVLDGTGKSFSRGFSCAPARGERLCLCCVSFSCSRFAGPGGSRGTCRCGRPSERWRGRCGRRGCGC